MTSLRLPADAAVGTHTRSNPIESPHSWYVRLTDCDIYIGKGLEERESKELWWANGLSIFVGKWRNVGLTSYQISEVLLFLVSCLFVLTSLHSKALWPNFTCLYMFFIASGITSLETAPHRFPATHQRCLRGLLPMYHTWPWRWWLVMYDRITGFQDFWLVPWSCKPSSHPHCQDVARSWKTLAVSCYLMILVWVSTWWYLYGSFVEPLRACSWSQATQAQGMVSCALKKSGNGKAANTSLRYLEMLHKMLRSVAQSKGAAPSQIHCYRLASSFLLCLGWIAGRATVQR